MSKLGVACGGRLRSASARDANTESRSRRAKGGEKVIRLPRRAKVTMLYPERRELGASADRIVFTPQGDGMSTTIFRWQ